MDKKIFVKAKRSEANLLLSIGFNLKRETYQKSTGINIPPECWRDGKIVNQGAFKEAKQLNEKLEHLKGVMKKISENYAKMAFPPDKKTFDKDWKWYSSTQDHSTLDFHLSRVIKDLEAQKTRVTISIYRNVKYAVNNFEAKKTKKPFLLSEISSNWFSTFCGYLVEGSDYKCGYVHKLLSSFRFLLRKIKADGYHIDETVLNMPIPLQKHTTEKPILNEEELERISKLELTNDDLEEVRTLFLLGCYTGLRFSDVCNLGRENIVIVDDVVFLKGETRKTSSGFHIPVSQPLPFVPDFLELVEKKIEMDVSRYINQPPNEKLRELCRLANIDTPFTYWEKRNNIKKPSTKRKFERITTHTGRCTFITLCKKYNVPTDVIKSITGIKRESTIDLYAKMDSESIMRKIANYTKENIQPIWNNNNRKAG